MNSYANDFTKTVQTYYKDLKKYNPIPKEKELDVIKQAKKNNLLAKNTILSSNLKFALSTIGAKVSIFPAYVNASIHTNSSCGYSFTI